jgi:hypothetical protein
MVDRQLPAAHRRQLPIKHLTRLFSGAMRLLAPLAAAVAAALIACTAHASAAGPTLLIGTSEEAVKSSSLVEAKAKMSVLQLAGFDSVRVTSVWWPGESRPDDEEVTQLRNAISAARLLGIRVFISIFHHGNRTTPLTEEARMEFAGYAQWIARTFPYVRDFVIGNEPNLNRFWLPQFNEDGTNAAAPAYMELLGLTYDALKTVSRKINVIGGALAPRGTDRPGTSRDTHSPTRFIRDLGDAYRLSGRPRPLMDELAIHPYGTNSSERPSVRHQGTTVGLGDYAKLVRVLGESFDGTAQKGSTLPIAYEEYGVETQIPQHRLRSYTGNEPTVTRPVSPAIQAAYYRQAIELAFCQPNVRSFMIFHLWDEPARPGWQSGLYFADGWPKASLTHVRQAMAESRRGVVARCPRLALEPKVLKLRWPRGRIDGTRPVRIQLTCSIDCAYTAALEDVTARAKRIGTVRGRAIGRTATTIVVPARKAKPGRYRVRLWLVAAVNRGRVLALTSPLLTAR